MPPFTAQQFFDVFANYNRAVWPAQVALTVLGVGTVGFALRPLAVGRIAVPATLAVLWGWAGVAYHLGFFAQLTPAGIVFGGLFVAQGALFAAWGLLHPNLRFGASWTPAGIAGALLIAYALAGYPAFADALGQHYPTIPTFGTPCPVAIYTFGLLLWTDQGLRRSLLWIPLAWTLIGSTAAFAFGVREDLGLLAAGLIAAFLLLGRRGTRAIAGG